MIGSGRTSIASAAELSKACFKDLGSGYPSISVPGIMGKPLPKSRAWFAYMEIKSVICIHGFASCTISILKPMKYNVRFRHGKSKLVETNFKNQLLKPVSICGLGILLVTPLKAENIPGRVDTEIPFLLPHEIFATIAAAGKHQVRVSGYGYWYT